MFRQLSFLIASLGAGPILHGAVAIRQRTLWTVRRTAEGLYCVLEQVDDAGRVLAMLTDLSRARAYLHTLSTEGR